MHVSYQPANVLPQFFGCFHPEMGLEEQLETIAAFLVAYLTVHELQWDAPIPLSAFAEHCNSFDLGSIGGSALESSPEHRALFAPFRGGITALSNNGYLRYERPNLYVTDTFVALCGNHLRRQ